MDDGGHSLETVSITSENQDDESEGLTLTIPPPSLSQSSPTKVNTSPRSPKRSPTKHQNLLNIDLTATLAAISARLAIVVPHAESEIARINREVLASMANKANNGKNQNSPLKPESPRRQGDAVNGLSTETATNSSESSSPSKSGMTPALYDSVIAEEWVNLHLETSGAFLLPATDITPMLSSATSGDDELDIDQEAFSFRKGGDGGPLGRAGMDRHSLYRMGMPKDLVDRLYRALYVYTNGFHNIINEISAHCPPGVERHVSSNAWLTFLLLLEQCENGKYEMAMLKFKQAAQDATKQLQEAFRREKMDLEAQVRIAETAYNEEAARGVEKSELIRKLVTETTESSLKISEQQQRITAQAEQIRLLRLEVLVHEDEEKKLNDALDDTRRDYEVANSERLNALSERFALDDEIRKLTVQLDRVEAEKANYARRMHETLFMNQALRANNDQLKQDAVVLGMEKNKVITEKETFQEQIEKAQAEISHLHDQKIQLEKDLIEKHRMQGHLEARLQTMKEQFDIEVENNAKHQTQIVRLAAQIDEEKVQTGVFEAKCNLLTAEKKNSGMRAQDKLRIERLLNQKAELEATVEANKLDRKRDEEQIWSLRTSLEALDAEMQHNKRVYSAGQQAYLHAERMCEQFKQQTQELEKNYEKAKKTVASLKERFKTYETTAKEQITKLEVEVKVSNAQLREVTYVNRDNAAQIDQLTKSLTLAEKESSVLKARIEESDKHVEELKTEKEDMQRNQKELDLASSTSKNTMNRFILSLQNMLALVKLDEFPLDEAIRELLQMIQDTFGEELQLDNVLEDDDTPEEMELDVEEDVAEQEQLSRQRRAAARRKGIVDIADMGGLDFDNDQNDSGQEEMDPTAERKGSRRETVRMSRFRKNKLDHLVNKLQKDIALKAEFIANLESVVCEQNREISQLTTTTKQQARLLVLNDCQKSMLQSDLEMTTLMLFNVRRDKRALEFTLEQVRIDQVLQTNRAFQAEVALATLRREFDMQVITNEDLMSKIWHEYEHRLYMISLRRDKEVQATVTMSSQQSQTLVPQRNPAMERPRMASLYIPAQEADATGETLLQKITKATRQLLPNVVSEMELQAPVDKLRHSPKSRRTKGLVRPLASSPRGSRTQLRTQLSQEESRRRHPGKHRSSREAGTSALPMLDDNVLSSPTQLIHHVNEFGTRQTMLASPDRPPYFNDQRTVSNSSLTGVSPRPPAHQNSHQRKPVPRKLNADNRAPLNNLQIDPQYEERVETSHNARRTHRSPVALSTHRHAASPPASLGTNSTLRYNRSFLRAGMEVLRNAGSPLLSNEAIEDEDELSEDDEDDGDSSDKYERPEELPSPSRLATQVSDYQREQMALHESEWRQQARSPRRFADHDQKRDEVRTGETPPVDKELAARTQHSHFTAAVLYPMLPDQ